MLAPAAYAYLDLIAALGVTSAITLAALAVSQRRKPAVQIGYRRNRRNRR